MNWNNAGVSLEVIIRFAGKQFNLYRISRNGICKTIKVNGIDVFPATPITTHLDVNEISVKKYDCDRYNRYVDEAYKARK